MENNLWVDMAVAVVLSTLKGVKGPKKKEQFKKIALKIFTTIKMVYADDEDFA